MKKLATLLLAVMMLLSVAAVSSADAFYNPVNRADLGVELPALPSIPTCKVVHNEKANTYTVTTSENPVWACANLWYNKGSHVDGITFNENVATFKGTKAQIGLWWLGGPYYSEWLDWVGKDVYETYDDVYTAYADDERVCGKFLVIEEEEWGWNIHTEAMSYSGDDALLIGYSNMNVWYTRGGKPIKVTVPMSEDPFQTGRPFNSASVTYTRDGKNSGHWYISNIEANYGDSVSKISVDYNDTTVGNWLRYNVTLASGGTLKYSW